VLLYSVRNISSVFAILLYNLPSAERGNDFWRVISGLGWSSPGGGGGGEEPPRFSPWGGGVPTTTLVFLQGENVLSFF